MTDADIIRQALRGHVVINPFYAPTDVELVEENPILVAAIRLARAEGAREAGREAASKAWDAAREFALSHLADRRGQFVYARDEYIDREYPPKACAGCGPQYGDCLNAGCAKTRGLASGSGPTRSLARVVAELADLVADEAAPDGHRRARALAAEAAGMSKL